MKDVEELSRLKEKVVDPPTTGTWAVETAAGVTNPWLTLMPVVPGAVLQSKTTTATITLTAAVDQTEEVAGNVGQ